MKKFLFSFVRICLVLLVIISGVTLKMNAEGTGTDSKGIIYVNDVELNNEDTIIVRDDQILFPLRAVLEALGSTVQWEESTGNIYFDYADENYVCKFVILNPYFPDDKNILVCKAEDIESKYTKDHIQLNSWGADGFYCMINDRTYLYQETGKRLLEALGCTVEIDAENCMVKISNEGFAESL